MNVDANDVDFNRDVRPLLSDRCFACHGPDANTREAELRLDQRDSAIQESDGHAAIAPGMPEKSELLARITSHDESVRMPPPEAGKPLTTEEIGIIRAWIEQGAEYEAHWSYRPLRRPDVPEVTNETDSPIDAFIRRRQIETGADFNSPADRRTLIRRVSFDLTGLPPTFEDVQAFQNDSSADAYEKLVDRLLQSPHYGERMAIYWLDLVRYADTLGFHGDQVRSVSPYRDYVISAFNENLPFDQFTTEQLAGDLLPNATLRQKVASTYNRINRASAEGGVQPNEYLAKYAADRVRTAGSVWLGSTFGCSECHDHKFDPFTTKDFYSFAAFFADVKEQGIVSGANHIEQMPVPTPEQAARQSQLSQQIANAEQEFRRETPELTQAFEEWQVAVKAAADRWHVLKPTNATATNEAVLSVEGDGTILATGPNPDQSTYSFESPIMLHQIGAVRLEILAHDSLPAKGPGRAGNGNFVVNTVTAEVDGQKLEWAAATSTHDQGGFPATNLVSTDKGWAILPKTGQDHQLLLEAKQPVKLPEPTSNKAPPVIKITIDQKHGASHTLGRLRISVSTESAAGSDSLVPSPEVAAILESDVETRTAEQTAKLMEAFRAQTPLLKESRDKLASLRKEKQQLDSSIVTTLVTVATQPREMRVLPRGNWMDSSGEVVMPSYPEFLTSTDSTSDDRRLNRLDLAHWLTSPDNPLVARTFVNRLWMLFYGHGLSRSVDDLGSQGEPPTHPELLDWLAAEFIESGWDVKHLVKLLVTTRTYQQSSIAPPELLAKDPFNKLFARQSRWRLDAEMVRDNALAVSGLLVTKVGGVSAMPYQPAGYWDQLNFPKRTYQHDANENQYRRGVYTHWQRTFLHPSLLAFDAPPREECTARRDRSNTPLQALVLLNDPTYVEAARVFAEKICHRPDTSFDSRLNFAFNECLAREPNDAERAVLKGVYENDLANFQTEVSSAESLLKTGLAPLKQEMDPAELAAWTSVSRVILNLHETITRY